MRTPSEWNVLMVTRFASSGREVTTRSRISSAALFVNVTATMRDGSTFACRIRCAIDTRACASCPSPRRQG
jgi:hypothetical protein